MRIRNAGYHAPMLGTDYLAGLVVRMAPLLVLCAGCAGTKGARLAAAPAAAAAAEAPAQGAAGEVGAGASVDAPVPTGPGATQALAIEVCKPAGERQYLAALRCSLSIWSNYFSGEVHVSWPYRRSSGGIGIGYRYCALAS